MLRDDLLHIIREDMQEDYGFERTVDHVITLLRERLTSDEAVKASFEAEEAYDDEISRDTYAAGIPFEGFEEDARKAAITAALDVALGETNDTTG